jgi:hypothetical protein
MNLKEKIESYRIWLQVDIGCDDIKCLNCAKARFNLEKYNQVFGE